MFTDDAPIPPWDRQPPSEWPPTADLQADAIAKRLTMFNHPAPDKPGMRMVGWYVPDDQVGLGSVFGALERIAKAWRNWREIGTRPL